MKEYMQITADSTENCILDDGKDFHFTKIHWTNRVKVVNALALDHWKVVGYTESSILMERERQN